MKQLINNLTTAYVILLSITTFAQPPQVFNYQKIIGHFILIHLNFTLYFLLMFEGLCNRNQNYVLKN